MSADRVLERCDELARLSEEKGLITRWYGSESLVSAADLVARWKAGLLSALETLGPSRKQLRQGRRCCPLS